MPWYVWLGLGWVAGVNVGIVIVGLLRAAAAQLSEPVP